MMPSKKAMVRAIFFLPVAITLLFSPVAGAAEFRQAAGLLDLRTTMSDGAHSLDEVARLAKERGFDVIMVNDHDRMAMEYGLPPFRNLLRYRVEKPSVNRLGAANYLAAVEEAQRAHPELVILPGVETAPYYYWSGDPLSGLTAHDWERHLLVAGLDKPEDIASLPAIHNKTGEFDKRRILAAGLGLAAAALGGMACRWRGGFRPAGILLLAAGTLFTLDTALSLKAIPLSPYDGDQGAAPYQNLIDYVSARGGVTLWNHLETKSGMSVKPPIRVATPSAPQLLATTSGYNGFAAVYGEAPAVAEPGNDWDGLLLGYLQGKRAAPVWAVSTGDFHEEGHAGEFLGNFPTVFWVRELSRSAVLDALKHGRMYAARGHFRHRPVLEDFSVADAAGGNRGISGESVRINGPVRVHIALRALDDGKHRMRVRLMRDGAVIATWDETTPLAVEHADEEGGAGKRYYRLNADGEAGIVVANPVFVETGG